MEKLEFKHIAPYLLYGIKMIFEKSGRIEKLTGLMEHNDLMYFSFDNREDEYVYELWNFKPILHPLSDLTKDIEVNGEIVNTCLKFGLIPNTQNYVFLKHRIEMEYISYKEMQLLISYHFDVFGLIEKGLAVDINTLNE